MTTNNTGPNRTPLGQNFFNWVRSLDVRRGDDRWIGGVCSGLARRVGWDPLLMRIIWFASLFIGGVGLAAYGIAWLLLPDERDGTIPAEELTRGRCTGSFVMAVIFLIIGLPATTATLPVLALVLIGAVIFAIIAGSRGTVAGADAAWSPGTPGATGAGPQQPGPGPSSNPWNQSAQGGAQGPQGGNMRPNTPNNPYNGPYGGGQSGPYAPGGGSYGNPYAYQPYAQRPVPPTQPARPAEVRKPAGPAITGAMYGLTLITLAAVVMWQVVAPRDYTIGSGLGSAQLWVLGMTAVTGAVLIALGIAGRRTGGLMPLAVIGLVLSLMVAGGAQVRVSVNGYGPERGIGSGSELTFSDAYYSSQDYRAYRLGDEGLDLMFSSTTLDLSDWQQVTGEICPTDTLDTDTTFSDLTIVLPQGCDYSSSGMNATFGTVFGQNLSGADRIGSPHSADPSRTLTLTGDVTFGHVTIKHPSDGDSSGSSGSSLDSSSPDPSGSDASDPSSPMNS